MFGGQSIGIAAATALSGPRSRGSAPRRPISCPQAHRRHHIYLLLLTERAGERRVPWSAGDVHPATAPSTLGRVADPREHCRLDDSAGEPVLAARAAGAGVPLWDVHRGHAAIGTGNVGWSEARVTSVVGTAQFVAGILGLTLGGWLGDRFGAKKSTIAMFAALMAMSAAMWFSVANWGDPDLLHRLRLRLVRAGRPDHLRGPADLHAVVRPCRRDPVHALHGDQQFRDQPRGLGAPLQQPNGRVAGDVRGGVCAAPGRPMLMVLVRFPRRMTVVDEIAVQLAERDGPQPVINRRRRPTDCAF